MKNELTKIPEKLQEIQRIREEITETILALPDNPNIKRVSDSPRCFTMSSRELFGKDNPTHRMDVFYHDFRAQYEKIAEVVNSAGYENILPTLQSILATGTIGGKDYHRFHPRVIEHLRSILA